MLISLIANLTKGCFLQKYSDIDVEKICIDSRKVQGLATELFIAIEGPHNDGHNYVDFIVNRGVKNIIVEKTIQLPTNLNVLKVDNSLEALQQIASHHRMQFHYPVVGITGSNGKTIIKEWLYTLLSEQYKVVKSPKSYNSEVGVPLSLLEMGDHDMGIFEAGISGINQMESLAKMIRPTIGIFTNLGNAHDEGFENENQKLREKIRLFHTCEKIICCEEHSKIYEVLSKTYPKKVIAWSTLNADSDYFFERHSKVLIDKKKELKIPLPFTSHPFLENALHSLVASLTLQMNTETIMRGISKLQTIPMRLEMKKGLNNCYLINDSYNADIQGLEVALDFMNSQNPHQKKTIIISDFLQTGLPAKQYYKSIQNLIENKNVNRILTIGSETKKYVKGQHFDDVNHLLRDNISFQNETLLLKGARPFQLERIAQNLEAQAHETVLEINLEALRHNLNAYRKQLHKKCKTMVMVKAFAYGTGLVTVTNLLQEERIDYLGVAFLDEAIQLRQSGIYLPIMILNTNATQFDLCEKYNLEPEIYSLPILKKLIQSEAQVRIHIKLETGMNRLGIAEEDISELILLLKKNPHILVSSIFTHLSASDQPQEDDYSHKQVKKFNEHAKIIMKVLPNTPFLHVVNSTGILRFPQYHLDMVRLGIGLYGYDSTQVLKLETVAKLKTKITQIKEVKAGEYVGYGNKGKVRKNTKIAVIPIGYADGLLRILGNGIGKVGCQNRYIPTIGNICMDMSMIAIGDADCKEGDEVVIFGDQPTIEMLASWAGTIPYEIMSRIGSRVKRIYVSE